MSRSGKFDLFKQSVELRCLKRAIPVRKWRDPHNRGGQVLDVADPNSDGLLIYVKDSELDKGFWSVNRKICHALDESRRDWRLVLLVRTAEEGYLYSRTGLETIIPGTPENISDYFLYEPMDTGSKMAFHFNTFSDLFTRLGL